MHHLTSTVGCALIAVLNTHYLIKERKIMKEFTGFTQHPVTVVNYDMNTKVATRTSYDKMGEVSDGYHTFNELYEFRKLYNAAFFNELVKDYVDTPDGAAPAVHKSYKHSDGELCFGGGWFIVTAYLNGKQISNHYENEDWDLFHCPERDTADEWDGHTPQDVVERLTSFIKSQP